MADKKRKFIDIMNESTLNQRRKERKKTPSRFQTIACNRTPSPIQLPPATPDPIPIEEKTERKKEPEVVDLTSDPVESEEEKETKEKLERSDECCVCLNAKKNTVLKHKDGTGHLCVCHQCACNLIFSGRTKCPICMQVFVEKVLVYS